MAGTLYYFYIIRNNIFTYCIIVVATIFITKLVIKESSALVEEMYHKQLVTTINSIFDARFITCCCKENIDSDDISIPQTLFHKYLNMEMME